MESSPKAAYRGAELVPDALEILQATLRFGASPRRGNGHTAGGAGRAATGRANSLMAQNARRPHARSMIRLIATLMPSLRAAFRAPELSSGPTPLVAQALAFGVDRLHAREHLCACG